MKRFVLIGSMVWLLGACAFPLATTSVPEPVPLPNESLPLSSEYCVPPDMPDLLSDSNMIRVETVTLLGGKQGSLVILVYEDTKVVLLYHRGVLIIVDPAPNDATVPMWARTFIGACSWKQIYAGEEWQI